jgi:AraC family transcriptional regulator
MHERLGGREHRLYGAAVGYKPPGAWHADAWGDGGALIFSLRVAHERVDLVERLRQPGWTAHECRAALADVVRACFADGNAAHRVDAAHDALALAAAPGGRIDARAPAWLERVRHAIVDAPYDASVDALAREAGVHRVHLSRWFVRHYGIAPSALRRRVAAAHAIGAVVRSPHSLTDVAHDGGYADQAHMTRALRAAVGVPPSRLRTLLRT